MYSVIVLCNICTFQFVCLINDKVKIKTKDILGDKITSTELEKGISWKSLFKAQNRIAINKYPQLRLDAHSSVVKNILKLDEMCTVLFVWFVSLISSIYVCLFDDPNYQSPNRSCT